MRGDPVDSDVWREASELAAAYHWPDAAESLARGVVPLGFCREVGSEIALFLALPVMSGAWLGICTREQEERANREARGHAVRLVRLRVLLASMRLGVQIV